MTPKGKHNPVDVPQTTQKGKKKPAGADQLLSSAVEGTGSLDFNIDSDDVVYEVLVPTATLIPFPLLSSPLPFNRVPLFIRAQRQRFVVNMSKDLEM